MNHVPNQHQPAFPFQCQGPTTGLEIYYGLSKRDYIAIEAMKVWIAQFNTPSDPILERPARVARLAYIYADALIAESEKQ